jgi:hypothetical protein
MKREIYIYSVLGVFTCLLIYYQFNFSFDKTEKITSKIKPMTDINQLLIDVNCNIFLMEGDGEYILVEGPDSKIQQIQAIDFDGCIRITENKGTFLAGLFGIFKAKQNDINIYITINDLEDIKFSNIGNKLNIKYISSDCLGLILSRGQKLIIESKFINSSV